MDPACASHICYEMEVNFLAMIFFLLINFFFWNKIFWINFQAREEIYKYKSSISNICLKFRPNPHRAYR